MLMLLENWGLAEDVIPALTTTGTLTAEQVGREIMAITSLLGLQDD